jgi:hypothetical protein
MTVQVQDSLNLDGELVWIAGDMVIVPHPRIRKLNDEEAIESCEWTFSTACHRGFLANWEIKDGKLYLIDVIGIFNLIGEELLFAEWYSGRLCVQAGAIIKRPSFGYDSGRERDIEIEVKDGMVIRRHEAKCDPPKSVAGYGTPPFLRK